MRLFSRLLLSHLAPLLLVVLALGLTLSYLFRMTAALDELERAELDSLRREGELHRSAWSLDISMRHATDDCRAGRAPPEARKRIAADVAELRKMLSTTDPTSPQMRSVIEAYLDAGHELLDGTLCARLLGPRMDHRRDLLDERLTNLWMARLDQLHLQVEGKKTEARQAGGTALMGGVLVGVIASVVAIVAAGRLAGIISRPLDDLARTAQRVGRGDFGTPVAVRGPPEFVELAAELERMREQLRQLETLKQSFLASISHELRTPLSKLREGLALLQDGVVGEISDAQREVLDIAREACEREIRLVSTLLDLSRLRAGSPVRTRDATSIDEVVARAVQDESPDAAAREVEIAFEPRGSVPPLQLDPVLMERAVANLIRNAVAVSKPGQRVDVTREVTDLKPDAVGSWIKVAVRDRGPGVPAEIRDSMFQTFVTQPVPNSGKGIGFGLGLALSCEVAQAHGGDVSLDETVPEGARFDLWLPAPPPSS